MRRQRSVTCLCLLSLLAGCDAGATTPQSTLPAPDPLLRGSTGIERMLEFKHRAAAAHTGVDAVRMPRQDRATGEWRDDQLLVAATGTGIYAALVDDGWNRRAEAFWPVAGTTMPWADVRAARLRDPSGRERAYVYFVSQGSSMLEIRDVTEFPIVTAVQWPIDLGLPVAVHGAHTLQLDEARGVLVLNGVHVGAAVLPPPLTAGGAPALFLDVATDPLRPQRLSVFVGPSAGDQVMFDSQFLQVDGRPVWAATIAQPPSGASYFAFYGADDPAHMDRAPLLAAYAGPASGTLHNVVQLPPAPDGALRLCAGFEAFAFASGPDDVVSKAAVLSARDLLTGDAPQHVGWLVDDHNRKHSLHNPAARLLESGAHTWDAVPLAHFTMGYACYRCAADQDSVELLAHAPISDMTPSADAGHFHAAMNVPTWPAVYNGAWDAVATPIGDFVSSTDREASYLIEPTWGFVRQFGSYRPGASGTVARVRVRSGVPVVGAELRVEVTGVEPGSTVHLLAAANVADPPERHAGIGDLFLDTTDSQFADRQQVATTTAVTFTVPRLPAVPRIVLTAVAVDADGTVRKTPAALLRVRPR